MNASRHADDGARALRYRCSSSRSSRRSGQRWSESPPRRESTRATGRAARIPTACAAARRRATPATAQKNCGDVPMMTSNRPSRQLRKHGGRYERQIVQRPPRARRDSAPDTSTRDGRACRRSARADTSRVDSRGTACRPDDWARTSRRAPRARPPPTRGNARRSGSPARSPPAGSSARGKGFAWNVGD